MRDSGNLGKDFLELEDDCFLWQHVKMPTRGQNILDLVFSTEENLIEDVVVDTPISNSDHNTVVFKLIWGSIEEESKTTDFRYDKADFGKIQEVLNNIDWDEKFKDIDLEQKWFIFQRELNEVKEKFVPKAKRYKRSYPKWMTNKIK